MRIGLFTDCYYPQINGVVTSVMTLREELIKQGHEVTVITVQVPGYKASSEGIIKIKAAPKMKIMDFRLAIPMFYHDYLRIKALKLDLIHTHTEFTIGLFGRFMARRLKIPMIHTYHTMYEDYTNYLLWFRRGRGVVKQFMRQSSRQFVSRYDIVVVPSIKTKKALRRYGVRNDIRILPTGIDLKKFRIYDAADPFLIELRKNLNISDTAKIVLSLGRVSEEKSIDVILSQMRALSDAVGEVVLLIVGDGPYMGELKKMSQRLGIEDLIRFAGRVPWTEVSSYYSLVDVYVSASKTETQGLTILEAMACQVPVVVYDDDNIVDLVIERQTGRLFKNSNELTQCLIEFLTNVEFSEQIERQARTMAVNFSCENFGKEMETIYCEILNTYSNKYELRRSSGTS